MADPVLSLESHAEFLKDLEGHLRKGLDLAGLHSRNPVAHKWKAPMRCWILRETVARRSLELLQHSTQLEIDGNFLASRILARSTVETLSVLVYSNYSMCQVASGALDFQSFSRRTVGLLAGSRNGVTPHNAVGVLTMVDRLDKDFSGLRKIYDDLSEYAHPNYEGLTSAYSQLKRSEDRIVFFPSMRPPVGDTVQFIIAICSNILIEHYNNRFVDGFDRLERWLSDNNAELSKKFLDEPPLHP